MISERTLKKWRGEALEMNKANSDTDMGPTIIELSERILRMTQELLDQHLMRRG